MQTCFIQFDLSRGDQLFRSYHRVNLTGCFSFTLMGITVQTQLLNLYLNKKTKKSGNVARNVWDKVIDDS